MKYFHIENANRSVAGIVFEPYGVVAGCLMGVYASDDPQIIKQLDAAAKEPTSGVSKITESEYHEVLKKKAPELGPSQILSAPLPDQPIREANAAVAEGRDSSDAKATAEFESLGDALSVGEVKVGPKAKK